MAASSNEAHTADHQYVMLGATSHLPDRRAEIDTVGPAGSSSHICSLILNVGLLGLLVALGLAKSVINPLAVVSGIFFLAYVVHVFKGGAYAYLESISSAQGVSSVIDRLQREPGQLFISCVCSHETSSSSTDSDGNTSTSTSTSVTFQNRTRVPIAMWADVSDRLPEWASHARAPEVCKVKSEAKYEFASAESAQFVERLTALVYATHRNRDSDCTVSCVHELPGLLPRMLMLSNPLNRPWWLSTFWFLVASLFCLSWPYRMLLESNSIRLKVCFRKSYAIDPSTPLEVNMVNES